ncbi:hypothetical protein R1flu_022500 [Riccia fluitans]|uniref:Sperm-associated antigen 17 n=1 Tax=Riccia fluitans TaxID=41844 RepID=A0ABD1XPC9_9MARC
MGKKGKGKPESALPLPSILLSPREQWKLLEEGIARAKDVVFEAQLQVEVCLDNQVKIEGTLNDPFTTGHVYCFLGLDSALPIAELCAQRNCFFRGVFHIALKPKAPLILPESSGPSTPRDDDEVSVASTSSVSSSKSAGSPRKKKKSKKDKAAAKAAKVEAAVSAVPLLVAEIRSLKETCILMDPLRKVAVIDVLYEPAPVEELDFFSEIDSENDFKDGGGAEGEKEPKEKKKKEKKKKKSDSEEKPEEEGEKKIKKEKKDKKEKGKEARKGSKRGENNLPYKEIADALIAANYRLQAKVELYNQMGGDTCIVYTVPAAKPLKEVDTSYYKRLIREVPLGSISVPIIVHCLVEQVAAYSWPTEDLKALEVMKDNKRLLQGMEETFRKLGHPKWTGVDLDNNSKRFKMLYNFSQRDVAQSLIPDANEVSNGENDSKSPPKSGLNGTSPSNIDQVLIKKTGGSHPTKGETIIPLGLSSREDTGSNKFQQHDGGPRSDLSIPSEYETKELDMVISGDMHVSSTCGDCLEHEAVTGRCAVHHDHVDMDDEVELRKPETPELPYDPFQNPKDLEERLNVTHEFDRVMRLLLSSKPYKPQFMNSVDVANVEEYMSKIRDTPGRGRRKMPIKPEYSEEKMGASLTALQDLCEKYEEPRFAISDEDAIFHCAEHLADHPPSPRVSVQTLQRYKKLTAFFEMVKEDKLMLPDLDIPMEEYAKGPDPPPPVELVDPPDLSLEQMKDWCEICKRIFSQPAMRAKLPKLIPPPHGRPSIHHRVSVVERKKSLVEIVQEKKKSLLLDQDIYGLEKKMSLGLIDEPEVLPEVQEQGAESPTLEDLEIAERHYDTDPGLDAELVKSWCPVCARIFAVPTPPDLHAIWEERERMRLEMEQLAREREQAIIAAKIAAWERKRERLRESIVDRRHAEGFADGLMGEVYARAKLHLPFELLRYDRDEDCVLSILYAADGERTTIEEIPIYIPFGEFCLQDIDISKIGPVKKRKEAYELETRFRSIQDKRQYLLTENGGLVVCGLPSVTPVQYEPRTTVFKDGIIVTLRAPEIPSNQKEKEEHKVDDALPLKETDEDRSKEEKKGSSPDHNTQEGSDTPVDETMKPNKEKKKKEKSKKKEPDEQKDARIGVESHPGATIQTSLTASPVLDNAAYTSGLMSSEKQRTVMAFLVDGVIACFFFAKDGTLNLQVNNPLGRTFELTSSGVVAFLPLDSQNDEKPSTTAASLSPSSLKQSPQKDGSREGRPREEENTNFVESISSDKEGDKEGRSRKKENIPDGIPPKEEKKEKKKKKGGIPEGISPKDEEQGKKERKERKGDGKQEKEEEDVNEKKSRKWKGAEDETLPLSEPDMEQQNVQKLEIFDTKPQLTSDLQFLGKLYEDKQGEREVLRCILPTGTVISYKQNGQIQIMLNDGNVSEYIPIPDITAASGKTTNNKKNLFEESTTSETQCEINFGWRTTNNRGLTSVKIPESKVDPWAMESSFSSLNSEGKNKKGKSSNEKGGKVKDKGEAKDKEEIEEGKEVDQTEESEKGEKKVSLRKSKKVDFKAANTLQSVSDSPVSSPLGPDMISSEISPVDTVQHLEMPEKKVVEIYDPDSGSSILTREDLVIVVNADDQGVHVVQHMDGTHIYSEIKDVTPNDYRQSKGQQMFEDIKTFNANKTLPTLCSTSSRRFPVADKPRVLCTAQWHVRKDGFPNVHGNTKGGVAVEFSTVEGQYCATWSKESGQLSLMMPNGSMLYSHGKLVYFDPSDGTKKADPKQRIHDQLTKGRPFINTNGLYEFNLEKASLSFTDNAGNGFRTGWGFKVEPIIAGKLPDPPPQAVVGCGIEGPVDIGRPIDLHDFSQDDVRISDGRREDLARAAVSKADSRVKAPGTKAGSVPKGSRTKNAVDISHVKEAKKGAVSKASKIHKLGSEVSGAPEKLEFPLIPEKHDCEEPSAASITDPGCASIISTASSSPVSSDGSQERDETFLGPYPRLFVIHEGGFGFEILHEDDFKKFEYSKVSKKDCTRVMENYAKSDVMLHTFVTVEQKARKLAELKKEKHEMCRAPDGLRLWTKKVPEFARRIKLKTLLSKMQKRTKCDWLQLNLELPFLPRAVVSEMLPVMPLSNVTNIMFRQMFEYSPFERGQIRKMDKILEIYKEWQDSSMILRDVEVIPDERTPQEKKKAEEIARRIRESKSYKRRESAESLGQWLKYKESKKGPIPCRHEVYHLFQSKPPFRPKPSGDLLYFQCEEGLEFMYRLNFYRRPPPGPRRWSVETTPPRSEQGLDVFSHEKTGLGSDTGMDAYDLPARKPPKEEAIRAVQPETCIIDEWMKEEQKVAEEIPEEEGFKLCWELEPPRKPKREISPADWTPCFMEGFVMEDASEPQVGEAEEFEEEFEEPQGVEEEPVDPYPFDESDYQSPEDLRIEEPEPEDEAEPEEEPLPPLPKLPSFWQAPVGTDWQINNDAVQYQLKLLPNRPGWVKAEWRKNKEYLDLNLPTMLNMQISSVAQLKLRERPPIDWAHQFLLVPQHLDYGTVEYGTISMKVAFLQNYHGTNSGRFRFEDLGPCCRILCEYGMIPPGLHKVLRVFFRADRLGKFEQQTPYVP